MTATYYRSGVCFMPIPKEKIGIASSILTNTIFAIKNNDGYIGLDVTVQEDGITMGDDQCLNTDHLALLCQALVDGLEIDKPFSFYWAFGCDQLRYDSFGGGGCLIRRNQEPCWVNPADIIDLIIEESGEQ